MTMTDESSIRDIAVLNSRAIGCLLGGAVGDALGAGIEFDTWSSIARTYGPTGVTDFVDAYGRRGAITDDTQMTMFTTEGLIRACVRQRERGICHVPSVMRHAYLRWLWTQGDRQPLLDAFGTDPPTGWLTGVPALHSRRAPGNTCISALQAGGGGTIETPLNDSKGCGGVMRAAPAGFVSNLMPDRFRVGCELAVLTHGNPSGYLPAGHLAAVVGAVVEGVALSDALDAADAILRTWDGSAETVRAVAKGRELGRLRLPTPLGIELLGGGWTGHEALSIALACVESAPSFEAGVLAAVNHSGDSDSTGSIAGNILGALHGVDAIPTHWLDKLELRDEIEQLARDAIHEFYVREDPATDDWLTRYPGW
jgi:ADP-ribosyl-[dinitrogen reductase] hydrolase